MNDLISRADAINALWKALCEYEDKMEKQFQESDELDVGVWMLHRIFVQNMSDIDRQTILNLPSAQPMQWVPCSVEMPKENGFYLLSSGGTVLIAYYSDGEWLSELPLIMTENNTAWMPLPQPYKGG